jgi:hypothetical protein
VECPVFYDLAMAAEEENRTLNLEPLQLEILQQFLTILQQFLTTPPSQLLSQVSTTTPTHKMATDSFSRLWTQMNFDGDAQMSNLAPIVDKVDLLLMMEIEIPASANTFSDLDDPRRNSLCSTLSSISDYDYAPIQKPASQKQQASFDFSHQIAPDQKKEVLQLPNLTELQLQYQNTLKKLAKSMKRSRVTRSMIKRQSKLSSILSIDSDDETDFFTSPRRKQLEQSRKGLFCLISRAA